MRVDASAVKAALATVNDPEIKRPITEIGMVDDVLLTPAGDRTDVTVKLLLTVAGCPLKDTLRTDITNAVTRLDGIGQVTVEMGVMSPEQRQALQEQLRGGRAEKEIPFARADSTTTVYAIASGKGGVGKSSVTVNLAAAMAAQGRRVGILDADIYGHSVPAMLGLADERPTKVEDMIMPITPPGLDSLSVISIGMLKAERTQAVAWRGPMLDRALAQLAADVFWGDLDVLFLDLPPGTGDMAISVGQRLPNAKVIVVTTPQEAAAEVAERAGTIASMMRQQVAGVVENMSYLACPHCGSEHRLEIFGSGGGARVARTLEQRFGHPVPLLGQVPIDERLRAGGDDGTPLVLSAPDAPAAAELAGIADTLAAARPRLAGRQLSLSPVGR